MIEELPALVSTLGFPIAVVCFLLWERHHNSKLAQEERLQTMLHFEKAIKVDLVNAINDMKTEIVKLNERCSGGKKT